MSGQSPLNNESSTISTLRTASRMWPTELPDGWTFETSDDGGHGFELFWRRGWSELKMERVWQRQYANHDEARRGIDQYIVAFCNPVRLHSTLGYLSPTAYEPKLTAKESICLAKIT
jgi:hypothetical protein